MLIKKAKDLIIKWTWLMYVYFLFFPQQMLPLLLFQSTLPFFSTLTVTHSVSQLDYLPSQLPPLFTPSWYSFLIHAPVTPSWYSLLLLHPDTPSCYSFLKLSFGTLCLLMFFLTATTSRFLKGWFSIASKTYRLFYLFSPYFCFALSLLLFQLRPGISEDLRPWLEIST